MLVAVHLEGRKWPTRLRVTTHTVTVTAFGVQFVGQGPAGRHEARLLLSPEEAGEFGAELVRLACAAQESPVPPVLCGDTTCDKGRHFEARVTIRHKVDDDGEHIESRAALVYVDALEVEVASPLGGFSVGSDGAVPVFRLSDGAPVASQFRNYRLDERSRRELSAQVAMVRWGEVAP